MKIFFAFLAIFLLAPSISVAQISIVNHEPYFDLFERGTMRPYTFRISAMVPAPCGALPNIRSANDIFSGDYFWPPSGGSNKDSIERPTINEKRQIALFLKDYFPRQFQNRALIDSAQAYSYRCLYTPDSIRHEFYLMLSEGDTIYVISGWTDKFISFFRAVPWDKKLEPDEFIAQAINIAPALGQLGLSDSLVKIDTGRVWGESTYFLQAYDNNSCIWLRHYPIKAVLPPYDTITGVEKSYNLIEISKLYNRAYFDKRLTWVLHNR